MDDYSEMSENTTTRGGSFMYQSIAPGSSGYGRRSNSSSSNMQQEQDRLNRFHERSSEFFVSEVHPNVKIEGSSSQTLHEFNYPFVRGHQTVQQQQQNNESDIDAIKAKIVAHPQYSNLLEAYMDCQKVGAPPEVVDQLTAMGREFETRQRSSVICRDDSTDPELDQFMEAYYDMLVKYREELTRPIQEAMDFMRRIESQLNTLSNGSVRVFSSDEKCEGVGSSEEDQDGSGGETELPEIDPRAEDRELKHHLLKKYSGYLSHLKQELSKKRKKGKLPKDARQKLLNWWELHYKWPYPSVCSSDDNFPNPCRSYHAIKKYTDWMIPRSRNLVYESLGSQYCKALGPRNKISVSVYPEIEVLSQEAEKVALAESTGLDQKQINNWFINQRKRHWKPSEDMQFVVMDGLHPQNAAMYMEGHFMGDGPYRLGP